MTPPGNLEPTPAQGHPILVCPHCHKPIPRLAYPPPGKVALMAIPQADPVAPELADQTPIAGQPVDRRTAETERLPPES